jgi:hypothetical protein
MLSSGIPASWTWTSSIRSDGREGRPRCTRWATGCRRRFERQLDDVWPKATRVQEQQVEVEPAIAVMPRSQLLAARKGKFPSPSGGGSGWGCIPSD